jgi:hypothetical protein
MEITHSIISSEFSNKTKVIFIKSKAEFENLKKSAGQFVFEEDIPALTDKEKIIAFFSVLGTKIEIKDAELNKKYETILTLISDICK